MVIVSKVDEGLEEMIVGHLVDNQENARYVQIIPIQLLESYNSYDPQLLINLALKERQQNRLGYLVDIAIELAEIHELKGIENKKKSLRHISSELEKKMNQKYDNLLSCLSESWQKYDEEMYKDADELRRKWKIITDLTPDSLDDYMDIYITRRNLVKDHVPPNFNLADYR